MTSRKKNERKYRGDVMPYFLSVFCFIGVVDFLFSFFFFFRSHYMILSIQFSKVVRGVGEENKK